MRMSTILLAFAVAAVMSACTFVDKSPGSDKVRVLASDEIKTCRKLGQTRTSVLDKLAGIPRPPETIERELEIIGSNSAVDMGGDTIVPVTPVVEGKRTFQIYKCVDPNAA